MAFGSVRKLDSHKNLPRYDDGDDRDPQRRVTQPKLAGPATIPTADQGARDPSIAYGARTRFMHDSGGARLAHTTQAGYTAAQSSTPDDKIQVGSYNLAGGATKEYRDDYG